MSSSSLSPAQLSLLDRLGTNLETGLTTEQAAASRRQHNDGNLNSVPPPVQCPAWLCILLPCIRYIPSMKAFDHVQTEDAELLRNGRWIRYDASSVVVGDILRLEHGDLIPADCCLLEVLDDEDHLLVDERWITGATKPVQVTASTSRTLYRGSRVVQGSAIAVVAKIGRDTKLAILIQQGKFPPTEPIFVGEDEDDDEAGISLLAAQNTPKPDNAYSDNDDDVV